MRAILLAAIAVPLCLEGELLPIRSYTTADGLASDHIDCIVPDSRGFIWFCTPEGLTRFDGYRMVTFGTADGLPHRAVDTFLETRAGVYLAGTERGLSQFHAGGSRNGFIVYGHGDGQFNKPIYALLESSSGRIWCATAGGLFEAVPGGRFRREPGLERIQITDLKEDAGGNLWVAATDGIYVRGKNGAIQHITKENGLPNQWVNALLLDRTGRLWAGTRNGLVLMRCEDTGGQCGVQRLYSDRDGLPARNVMALAEGPDGAVWMGTPNGIGRLITGSGAPVFRNLTRGQGLSDRTIVGLAADKAGNMWAATEGAGVMKIGSAGFVTFREQDGLPTDRVFSVLADRGGTVVAVTASDRQPRRAISVFDGVKFRAVVPRVFGDNPGWGQHQILLQARTGEWWAATKAGLCRFAPMSVADLARRQPKACYAQDLDVFRVFEDSKGGIWASAQSAQGDRLLRWDPARKAISWLEAGLKQHALVSAFAEDHSGNIWMGLWGVSGGELFRYDGRQFGRFKFPEGGPATIFALLADRRGRLWIGSDGGGLGLIENPGSTTIRVRTYGSASGLASDTVLCIVEDDMGRIYAGTEKGLDRLDPVTGHTKHFSAADGLAHGSFKSAFRDGSGNLWFATTQGLSRLTPTADRPPTIPSVLITDLQTGGQRYPVSQAGEALISPPKLAPSRNQLQVTFVGFNDEPEESLRYRYKLEGTDQAWHDTRDHTVNYAALEPGGYRFLVKAVNSEDQPSSTPAEIDFEVLPPFWRQWWFEALALAGLAGLVLAAHRYRVAQAVKLERMRTAIATDLHDDIGASLSQIAVLSEVARVDLNSGQTQPNDRLDRVATLARECAESMSDVVWSIRAEPEGLDSLIRRMREFASDLLESQGIGFELRAPEKIPHLQLSLQARRQLLLIFKECIHNAARHSRGTAVVAEFEVAGEEILLRVRDNGRGIDETGAAPGKSGGNGIPSMKRRAESLGGRMEWTASPGVGCAVEVHLPVRHSAFGKPGL